MSEDLGVSANYLNSLNLADKKILYGRLTAWCAMYRRAIGTIGLAAATKELLLQIDSAIQKDLKGVSCTKGCSFCCYLNVSISKGEALLLVPHVTKERLEHLKLQASYGDDTATLSNTPYRDRRCAFLKDGSCSVYADRPATCRKYYVKSAPKFCDTSQGQQKVLNVAISAAEIMCMVLALEEGEGSMPQQLLKIIG